MGLNSSCFVEIQVINNTQNITLRNPRTHFYSGRSLSDPQSLVAPGSSSSCRFTNSSRFWGCNGVLAYEADAFTLAIYFSNPIDHNLFSMEMGLELSLDRVHRVDLESAYDRLAGCSQGSSDSSMFPCVILKKNQDQVQLSAGPVTVTATMARGRSAVIRVEVEERGNSGGGAGRETLILCIAQPGDLGTLMGNLRTSLQQQTMQRPLRPLPETFGHLQKPIESSRTQWECLEPRRNS